MRHLMRFLVPLVSAICVGCVHRDFSNEPPVIPPAPEQAFPVWLQLNYFDLEMPLHSYIDATASRASGEDMPVASRHIVKILNASHEVVYSAIVADDASNATAGRSFDLQLPPGDYTAACWTDYVDEPDADLNYVTSEFPKVTLRCEKAPDGFLMHSADIPRRDAFAGSAAFSVTANPDDAAAMRSNSVMVEMRRPMAAFRFEASDLHDFIKQHKISDNEAADVLEGYKILFRYAEYMPCSFDAATDAPVNSRVAASFVGESALQADDDGYISLGTDFVFVHKQETSVSVAVEIHDLKRGEAVAKSGPFLVPLHRNKLTIVRGRFLTATSGTGVIIDTSFAGDYDIKI